MGSENTEKTVMLHTVNKSPFEKSTLESCLSRTRPGDAVLLIADRIAGLNGELRLYALGPDLAARGIKDEALLKGISVIDYGGFVDLVAEHEVTQTWL